MLVLRVAEAMVGGNFIVSMARDRMAWVKGELCIYEVFYEMCRCDL